MATGFDFTASDLAQLKARGITPEEAQRQLALALHGAHPGCELMVAGEDFDAGHPDGVAAFQANAGLWDRLEALGVARR